MNEVVLNILLAPLAILLYGSGLLLWPIRRWRGRKRAVGAKSQGFVFLGQCIAYVGVAVVAALRPRLLEHEYYWFVILIELNVVFTVAGVIAWIRDTSYERALEANNVS